METLRSFTVTVEIDTNKRTERQTFSLVDHGTTDDVLRVAQQWVDDQLNRGVLAAGSRHRGGQRPTLVRHRVAAGESSRPHHRHHPIDRGR